MGELIAAAGARAHVQVVREATRSVAASASERADDARPPTTGRRGDVRLVVPGHRWTLRGGGVRRCEDGLVIPVALALAFCLAFVMRWWAVPMVSAGWGVLVAEPLDLGGYLGAVGLAAINAVIGTGLGLVVVRIVRSVGPTPVRAR
jgi:hypothetical protein